MHSLSLSLIGLSYANILAAAQGTLSLSPSAAVPSGASKVLSPSFGELRLSTHTTDVQSINLLQNLADYTGTPPHLRIGGNTQDNLIYQSSYNQWAREVNPDSVAPNGAFKPDEYIFGPRFFDAIERFPQGTPITYGLNLAYEQPDYLSRIVEQAGVARSMLKNTNLVSFEIGNEPDLYQKNGFRNGPWDGLTYTQEWLQRASAIWINVLKGNGSRSQFFEPGATASTIGTSFEIMDLVNDGITVDANGTSTPYVAGFNQHDYYYYIGVSTYTLTFQLFTDFSTLTNQFSAWTTQLAQANTAGYPYFLREMGVVGPIGYAGITDTFAASLWTLNFFLYAATIGISSVQMHMTDNSNASAWQPIAHPPYAPEPFVRPNYYAWAAMTQIIGKGCATQVAPLLVTSQPPAYTNRIVGYTAYHQGQLNAIVLINTAIANVSETSKNSLTINLSLPNFAGKTLYLSYLTAAGADAKHGTTWNGTSYEQSGDGTPTKVDNAVHTAVVARNGAATLTLRDSQAVVANIGSYVGTRPANRTACSALARAVPDAASEASTGTGSASSPTQSSAAAASSSSSSPLSSTSILTASTSMMTAIMGSSSPTATATSVTSAFARQFLKFTLTTMIGLVVTLFL